MRSYETGKVLDGLWYLGHYESGVYWLEGTERSMIISGGMSYVAPVVAKQIEAFGLDEDRLDSVLILHAHFDHIGIIPFFRRRHPELKIYGAPRAWDILGNPKAVRTINEFSRTTSERIGQGGAYAQHDLDWPEGLTGEVVTDGQIISLGNMNVRIYETPGHSSCSISAYVPELKALFPSDGGGIPYRDSMVISANSNFTKYQESLEKLRPLEVELLGADHFGYVSGQEARSYIARAIELAAEERAHVEEVYGRIGDIDAAAAEVTETFFAKNPDYFLPKDIFGAVNRQMLKHIAQCMNQES